MGRKAKGRIYRPPGKTFLMIAYCGPKPDGSWGEIRESAKTDSEEAARSLLEKRLRSVENHREGLKAFEGPSAARLTVSNLLDAVKADWQSREVKGLAIYLGQLEIVRAAFGHHKAMTVTTEQVRRYISRLKGEELANATINRRLEIIGRAFKLAVEERRLAYAPKIPFLREQNARKGFFEKAELEQLLPFLPSPVDDIARFAYATAWRRGELLGLRWEWVDRGAREIRLPDSKNGEGRALPLDEGLWSLLEVQWERRRFETASGPGLSAFVFHRGGQPISRNTFRKQWKAACKKAKLPEKLFHDMRRTAARNMVRAGVPESIVMSVGGWKTRSVLDRYNITSSTDKLEALRRSRAFTDQQGEKSNVAEIAPRIAPANVTR